PGGLVFAAAISRWAARLGSVIAEKLYERMPEALADLPDLERTGWINPLFPGAFTGYSHRPRQVRAEARDAGLRTLSVLGIEGVAFLLTDLEERITEPRALQVLMDSARALEAVPELLGVSLHHLIVAERPR